MENLASFSKSNVVVCSKNSLVKRPEQGFLSRFRPSYTDTTCNNVVLTKKTINRFAEKNDSSQSFKFSPSACAIQSSVNNIWNNFSHKVSKRQKLHHIAATSKSINKTNEKLVVYCLSNASKVSKAQCGQNLLNEKCKRSKKRKKMTNQMLGRTFQPQLEREQVPNRSFKDITDFSHVDKQKFLVREDPTETASGGIFQNCANTASNRTDTKSCNVKFIQSGYTASSTTEITHSESIRKNLPLTKVSLYNDISNKHEKSNLSSTVGNFQMLNRRRSKLLEIDGVKYIVSMEPPATATAAFSSTGRSYSVPAFEFPGHNRNLNKHLPHYLINRVDCCDAMITQDKSWNNHRDKKSANINIEQFSANDLFQSCKVEALDHAALRLRRVLRSLNEDKDIPKEILIQNLNYSINVLESNFLRIRRFDHSSDEEVFESLSKQTPVPEEIKSWLMETFSNKKIGNEKQRSKKDRRSLRSVVHTVQIGMMLDKMSKRPKVDLANHYLCPKIIKHLKGIDNWNFDVFELEKISNGNALTYVCYQLLTKFDLMKRFEIPVQCLFSYCSRLQRGYRKHNNRYHNPIHAADVAQTLNCLLTQSGFVKWFSDLEIFSMIMAAVIHDVEHTGTTNNFHIHTKSNLAILYNDRSVLEQHHVSTAFRILQEDGCNILCNFSKGDYQDCRALMVEMVLATDMNQHFEQTKNMEASLERPDRLEKSKAMCLLLHSSDINHPSKPWNLHYTWTKHLVLEFFEQGDNERKLDLPISPLCDRRLSKVAQSQIGFINYVIFPTFSLLVDLFKVVSGPSISTILSGKAKSDLSGEASGASADILKCRFGDVNLSSLVDLQETSMKKLENLGATVFACIEYNKCQWIRKDKIESKESLFGEEALNKSFIPDPVPPELSQYLNIEDGADEGALRIDKSTSSRTLTQNKNRKAF